MAKQVYVQFLAQVFGVFLAAVANGDDGTNTPKKDEPAKAEPRYVAFNIQKVANKKLDVDFHTLPGNNLKLLPRGRQKMGDVEFVIGDKFVQLAGKRAPDYPEKIEGISITREVTKLHFLHGAGFVVSDGTPLGEYVIHYDDESIVKIPIEYGRNVRDWWMYDWDQAETPDAVIAWTGLNHASKNFQGQRIRIRLYRMTWINPHPEKRVVSFDYVARNESKCSPFLVAVSGEPSTAGEIPDDESTLAIETATETSVEIVTSSPAEAAAIEELRMIGALLEVDDEGKLIRVALSGPGLRQGIPRGTNGTVKLAATLKSIETLDLNLTQVTDEGLDVLKQLSKLRWLALNSTAITDAGLSHVKELKSLERLRLHATRVTDEGLKELSGLVKLKVLDLSKTGVTDAGLRHLEPLTELEELDLRNTEITAAGVAALRPSLPKTKIVR